MTLRHAILRGVYDQNREINAYQRPHVKTKSIRRRKQLSKVTLFVLFIAILFGAQHIYTRNIATEEKANFVIDTPVRVNETGLNESLPAAEAGEPVADFFTITNPLSYAMNLNDTSPTMELNIERLLDYSLILNDENVRLSSVFGLDVQTIVIDPGHGGRDPGAIGKLGTMEKDIVLDIAKGLKNKLEKCGRFHIILTREEDRTMSLAERVECANAANADLFISLHINALPQENTNVIETYYYGPPSDPETLKLAEQENKGSGISTKDFEKMIRKIANTFKEQESANLSMAIQHSLFTKMKKYDKDITDAGVKIAPFVVLLGVNAPSVLVEISCITDQEEELKLNTPAYRNEITTFLTEGTTRYLSRRNLHFSGGEKNGQKKSRESS